MRSRLLRLSPTHVLQSGLPVSAKVFDEDGQHVTTDRLTKLLNFLQMEVKNEERKAMALTGFGLSSEQEATKKQRDDPENTSDVPSGSALTIGRIKKCRMRFLSIVLLMSVF